MFYVGSWYYDPETSRYLNTDDTSALQLKQGELHGANIFTYCGNNPVMNVDPTGYMELSITDKYFKIRFNDWETDFILETIVFGTAAIDVLCCIGVITSVGAILVSAIGGVIVEGISFINHLGGHNGVQINYGRKWYTPNWMRWNSVSPRGSNNITQFWNATKQNCKKIVGYVELVTLNKIATKSGFTVIQQICRRLIDSYKGKTVVVGNY